MDLRVGVIIYFVIRYLNIISAKIKFISTSLYVRYKLYYNSHNNATMILIILLSLIIIFKYIKII